VQELAIMTKWEYKVVHANMFIKAGWDAVLNDEGLQGWELVAGPNAQVSYFIFKRPIASRSPD
jgi:hypothetical protein